MDKLILLLLDHPMINMTQTTKLMNPDKNYRILSRRLRTKESGNPKFVEEDVNRLLESPEFDELKRLVTELIPQAKELEDQVKELIQKS